jgi:transposase
VAGRATGPDAGGTGAPAGLPVSGAGQSFAALPTAEKTGTAAEKKSLHALQRDTEENRKRRQAFVERIATIAPERLIFLDESGVTTQMTRTYGRAPRGVRIEEATPQSHWKMLTMLGAMGRHGMVAMMTIEEATDADIFLAYLDHVLCPRLQPGDVIVMDNLSAHKVDGVAQRIAHCGAELLYLPPYSPDLNPIEKAWAELKRILRSAKARTAEALDLAITQALPAITPENAQAWFRLCRL